MTGFMVIKTKLQSIEIFIIVAAMIPKMYLGTILAFFVVLAATVSKQMEAIRQDLIKINLDSLRATDYYEKMIKCLRRQHIFQCQSLEKINQCFGIFILLEITFTFIYAINNAIYIFTGSILKNGDWGFTVLSGLATTDQMVHFISITLISDRIRKEVIN